MARPTKYTRKVNRVAEEYLDNCVNSRTVPFITELSSVVLGVHRSTLYDWANRQDSSGRLLETLQMIKTAQRWLLMDKALHGEINSRVAIFLLKNNHNMSDKRQKTDKN